MYSIRLSTIGGEIFKAELQRRQKESEITGRKLSYPVLPKDLMIDRITGRGRVSKRVISEEEVARIKKAIADGDFAAEIVPIPIKTRKGETLFDTDERPMETDMEKMIDWNVNGIITDFPQTLHKLRKLR